MKHLYIATPLYDSFVTVGYTQSMLAAVMPCSKAGIAISAAYKPGPYIHQNRNWLVNQFLKTGADTMMFIDADVTFDPQAVVRLYESEFFVCGGAYPIKEPTPRFPVVPLSRVDKGFIEVAYLPGGFMMIRREVFEKLRGHVEHYADPRSGGETIGAYFQNVIYPNGQEAGEDVEFCNRWRTLGGQVWCWPDIDFEHSGFHAWEGNYSHYLKLSEAA